MRLLDKFNRILPVVLTLTCAYCAHTHIHGNMISEEEIGNKVTNVNTTNTDVCEDYYCNFTMFGDYGCKGLVQEGYQCDMLDACVDADDEVVRSIKVNGRCCACSYIMIAYSSKSCGGQGMYPDEARPGEDSCYDYGADGILAIHISAYNN
ncbi:hypothetical protein TRVA0_056S00562 [Trichomonascus vanleenenianus]|uniref:uncharacterized protein n=1 Tax=Trichomonascus vanleenenianus TaxID=2268995 RepID=UPI003ECB737A